MGHTAMIQRSLYQVAGCSKSRQPISQEIRGSRASEIDWTFPSAIPLG